MFFSWGDIDEHQRLAVSPQTVLEEMGQLGVPEHINIDPERHNKTKKAHLYGT